MIVYRAANLIGIQDLRVSSYMIRDTYAAKDFDSRWGSVETVRDYPVVEGFELFALGDIVLLCPKSLASTSFSDWPSKSHACLPLDAKSLKLMPDKQESDEASARPQPTSATK
ncbi:hypothetical protein [Pseudomonas gingeri]|uniref:Uncharacterized protein n=1 Tax=Pseudomonas gingeri TaxID=117681 RepID=A0A7Y8BLD3_9PSED|nr:hypothetical protein [Pseudomonas gingeri]NWB47922.1 hypothetical protein [Pseudomonas gingeri]